MKQQIKPKDIKYWVFDMDGTLTQAVHNFPMIKKELNIPQHADILTYINALPEPQRIQKNSQLIEYELQLAKRARAAQGAVALVKHLTKQGYHLAILTRNNRQLAHITLKAIGLTEYFNTQFILGRDEAIPKPDPDGLLYLATIWNIRPSQMLIIGDFSHDLACGKKAGTFTLLTNRANNEWPELVDWYYPNCHSLLADLK